jgi:hypothetical protein
VLQDLARLFNNWISKDELPHIGSRHSLRPLGWGAGFDPLRPVRTTLPVLAQQLDIEAS